jgi:hypothetical protein
MAVMEVAKEIIRKKLQISSEGVPACWHQQT